MTNYSSIKLISLSNPTPAENRQFSIFLLTHSKFHTSNTCFILLIDCRWNRFLHYPRVVQLYSTLRAIIGLQCCNVTRKPRAPEHRRRNERSKQTSEELDCRRRSEDRRREEPRRVTTLCLQNIQQKQTDATPHQSVVTTGSESRSTHASEVQGPRGRTARNYANSLWGNLLSRTADSVQRSTTRGQKPAATNDCLLRMDAD